MALTPTTRATVNSNSGSVATGAFTPSDSSILVACVLFQNGVGLATSAMSGTGGASALSWTSRANASTATANNMRAEIWTAPIVTGSSSTVTATITSGSGDNVALAIIEFTGYDSGTPTGVNLGVATGSRSGAYSPALSGTSAGSSYVVAAGVVDGAAGDSTVGASWSSVYSVTVNGFAAGLVEHRTGALSTADWAKFDTSFSTGAAAIEIVASGGVYVGAAVLNGLLELRAPVR